MADGPTSRRAAGKRAADRGKVATETVAGVVRRRRGPDRSHRRDTGKRMDGVVEFVEDSLRAREYPSTTVGVGVVCVLNPSGSAHRIAIHSTMITADAHHLLVRTPVGDDIVGPARPGLIPVYHPS